MKAPHWRPAYVGIGSNLDSPREHVMQAISALDSIADSTLVSSSDFYQSEPMGPADQPDYINAVAALLTQMDPHALLSALQEIEQQHGRERKEERWGPRTLDLDLLAYSNVTMSDDTLTLPHPGIASRNFVLLPWCSIAPQYKVPGLSSVAMLCRSLNTEDARISKL